ncbi:MAG: RodZ domain-containing protein [Candidatus Margulisiibacteriota bacterium]
MVSLYKDQKSNELNSDLDSQEDITLSAPTPFVSPQEPIPSKAAPALTTGRLMQNARLKARISLEQLSKDTKIRIKYIQAIEDDNFSVIPERVAVKGFIKICAESLGLKQDEVLEHYIRETGERHKYGTDNKTYIANNNPNNSMKKGLTAVGIAVVLLILFMILNSRGSSSHEDISIKAQEAEPEQAVNYLNIPVIVPTQNSASTSQVPVTDKQQKLLAKLTVKAQRDVWLKVSVDEQETFHGMLDKGKSKTWYGQNTISIRSPEPDRVHLIYNDKDIGKLGEANKVTERIFQAEVFN